MANCLQHCKDLTELGPGLELQTSCTPVSYPSLLYSDIIVSKYRNGGK